MTIDVIDFLRRLIAKELERSRNDRPPRYIPNPDGNGGQWGTDDAGHDERIAVLTHVLEKLSDGTIVERRTAARF